jgi:hypothetical protein
VSSAPVDPVIIRLLTAIGTGTTVSDSVGALLLRLVNRVGALERAVQAQSAVLQKLSRPAALVADAASPPPNGTAVRGPVGRPPQGTMGRPPGPAGRRDAYPRRVGPDKFIASYAVDPDFDAP